MARGVNRIKQYNQLIQKIPYETNAATSYVMVSMVSVVKGGGRAPPTLTSLDKFFHHDGMHARKRPLPLCVYSVGASIFTPLVRTERPPHLLAPIFMTFPPSPPHTPGGGRRAPPQKNHELWTLLKSCRAIGRQIDSRGVQIYS
jgi:hypothetical protein